MYLWNRLMEPSPARFVDAAPTMVDAVNHVNEVSAYEFNLWATVLGRTGFGVSALCPDFGPFSDEMAARGLEDDVFRGKVSAAAACMQGTPEDSLWQVVHSVGDWPEAPAVLGNNIWQPLQSSNLLENVGWAMDLATYLGDTFGARAVVCTGGPGRALSVRVYHGYDSVADWQQRGAAMQADAGWQERMQAVTAIADGSTLDTGLYRRLV